MKTPQRKFVVEFKSGRRASKAAPQSIWGNTDFKALAREVADEAPALFKEAALEIPVKAAPTDKEGAALDSLESIICEPIAETGSSESEITQMPSFPTAAMVAHEAERPEQNSGKPSRRTKQRTETTHAIGAIESDLEGPDADGVSPTITYTGTIVSFDDLDALEEENRRLRRLRCEQLRMENVALKNMLDRLVARAL